MIDRERQALADVRAVLLDGVDETGNAPSTQRPRSGVQRRSALRPMIETAILALVVALGAQAAVQSRVVAGSSMEPTLRDGERVLVNRLAYLGGSSPQRGDVVIFKAWPRRLDPFDATTSEGDDFIKRVVGIPGDVIEIRSGSVILNGQPLNEPYLDSLTQGNIDPLVVTRDEYFVLGDNRSNSSDSRLFGTLGSDRIVGRAWLRYWPFETVGRIVFAQDEEGS